MYLFNSQASTKATQTSSRTVNRNDTIAPLFFKMVPDYLDLRCVHPAPSVAVREAHPKGLGEVVSNHTSNPGSVIYLKFMYYVNCVRNKCAGNKFSLEGRYFN